MSMSFKASPDGTYGEILVNGQVVAKLPVSGNAVIPNLVGTVSQSGGIPTGAVVERGSNANGEYVRFADGTQICSGTTSAGPINRPEGLSFTTADLSWTFPATFVQPPIVSGMVNGAGTWTAAGQLPTSTIGRLRCMAGVSVSANVSLSAFAIGRWF